MRKNVLVPLFDAHEYPDRCVPCWLATPYEIASGAWTSLPKHSITR